MFVTRSGKAGAALGASTVALGVMLAGPQVGVASAEPADATGSTQAGGPTAGAGKPTVRGKVTRGSAPGAARGPAAKGSAASTKSGSVASSKSEVAPKVAPKISQKVSQSVTDGESATTASASVSSPAPGPIPRVVLAAPTAIVAPAAATAFTGGPAASAVSAAGGSGSSPGDGLFSGILQMFRRNKAPTATANVAMVQSSGMVWGFVTGSDPEGDPLSYAVKKAPQHGSVTIDDKGVFTYSPGGDYSGPDTFTAIVNDGRNRLSLFGGRKNVVKVSFNTATDPAGTVFETFTGAAGSQPNPSRWTITTGQWIDSGVQTYTNSPDNIRLDGQGHLVLQARTSTDGYTSGEVVTKGKLDMMYGSTSARIQFPAGQGLWPAFWMLGSTYSHSTWNAVGPTGWPGAGEIDIMELVNTGTKYHVALHGPQISDGKDYYTSAGNGDFVGASGPISDLTTGFHDYWVMRAPDLIVVGVDDTKLAQFTPASLPADGKWVFNQPMYAILNLAVGGTWPGPPDETTPWPSTMLIDSFKYTPLS